MRDESFANRSHHSSLVPRVSLICVGSELLRGKLNTHASMLARRLASVGLELGEEHTVGDDHRDLVRTIRRAIQENHVVVVTGGLGPTFDDLTREASAEACGKPLVFSSTLVREIQSKFRLARHRFMPPANKRQAYLIEGAIPIPNKVGTAPGQWLVIKSPLSSWERAKGEGKKRLVLLPGPPAELLPMLDKFVVPRLRREFSRGARAEAHLHFVGVPESVVDQKIRPIILQAQTPHPTPSRNDAGGESRVDFTILAHPGLVDFDIFVSGSSRKQAQKRLTRIVNKIQKKMGRALYSIGEDYPLGKVVMEEFISRKATLSVAESCTGGMLAKRLTDIAGSSNYFLGGVVSYNDAVKVSALGVSPDTLRAHGAVSTQTAAAMAKGVREKLKSTWGLSITGIAGPAGATSFKPVGLVYIGLSGPHGTRTLQCHFRGSRDAIRQRSVLAALDLLRLIYL